MEMTEKFYQKEIECMPREELRKLQNERLCWQVHRMSERVELFRKRMDEKGLKPSDIKGVEDLHKLPFLTKADLRDAYPYGLMGKPKSECVRIHSTSGTTGKRVVAFYTQHDVDLWEDCCARAITAVGGTKEDVCQVAYGYGLFTGGPGLNGGSHKVGCLTLPMSSGNTDRQVQFMLDLGATILCCTPSYAAYIGESLKEMGYKPEDNKLKAGIFGAEPWTEEMRRDIEKTLGIKAYDIYGLTETSGPGVAYECSEQTGMHINEDHFIAEIIDPETGEVLPEGEKGELVFTSITKEAFPLLRYRTRDLTRVLGRTCPCGRNHVRIDRMRGRSDDMMVLRGVNIFPIQIEKILMTFPELASNYLITLTTDADNDNMTVEVELEELFTDDFRRLQELTNRIQRALKDEILLTPHVKLVPKGTLPVSEGKAVRVSDKRKVYQ